MADYEVKLVKLYRSIKDEKYRDHLYVQHGERESYLNLNKLYKKHSFNRNLYSKYIKSLDPEMSYKDYSSAVDKRLGKLLNETNSSKYYPGEISRKTKISQVNSNFLNSFPLSDRSLMKSFYSMLKKTDDLTEIKLVFNKKSETPDSYSESIVVYLYKTASGLGFILHPQLLVENNF